MLLDSSGIIVVLAGLVWHALLIAAVFLFDLGGEDIHRSFEERILDSEVYEQEFGDDD